MTSGKSILDAIGDTPLIEYEPGIFTKCEFMNPSGSIKARIAKYMIEKAEREGLIKPGDTIVEATSGNTGNAMSMVAAAKGYKMVVVMPSDFSKERVAISKAFGADVRLIGEFNVYDALVEARRLGKKDGWWNPGQFDNEWNVEENESWLTDETLAQLPEGVKIDAIVQGVGTGGTIIGLARGLKKKHNPDLKVFVMEPDEAPNIQCCIYREHLIEGIADGFVPGIIQRHRHEFDDIIRIKGQDSVDEMKAIARDKGMFVGPSSGANLLAARQIKAENPEIKTVLTLFCDEAEKYIIQHFMDMVA